MINLSPEDRDLAIRTLFGEAANDPASQAAVAAVILNRAKQSGSSVKDVVLAPKQFEPWSQPNKLMGLDPNSDDYKNLATIVDAVASGNTPDPTGGATLFYSPGAQKALGRKTPKWAQGDFQDIGQHRFYKGAFPTPKNAVPPTIVAGLDPGLPLRKPEVPVQPQNIAVTQKPLSFDTSKIIAGLGVESPKPGGGLTAASSFSQGGDMEAIALAMEQAGVPEAHIIAVTGMTKQKDGSWGYNA